MALTKMLLLPANSSLEDWTIHRVLRLICDWMLIGLHIFYCNCCQYAFDWLIFDWLLIEFLLCFSLLAFSIYIIYIIHIIHMIHPCTYLFKIWFDCTFIFIFSMNLRFCFGPAELEQTIAKTRSFVNPLPRQRLKLNGTRLTGLNQHKPGLTGLD